ncbi:hypothetical protein BST61_g6988 [Cercospora zeina]
MRTSSSPRAAASGGWLPPGTSQRKGYPQRREVFGSSDPVLDLDQSHYATRALHSAADPGTDDHASMSEPWERMRRTVLDIMPAVDARCTAVERDVAWGAVGVVEKPDNGDTRELMGERLGWKESVVQDTDLTGIDRRMGRRGGAPHV